MTLSPTATLILKIGSGLFWTLTYILIIRRGVLDKTYGMPVVALCTNIAWEFIFSFVHPHPAPQLQVNIVWFLFDCIIFWQVMRYGSSLFGTTVQRTTFIVAFLAILIASTMGVLFISYEFSDFDGKYAAFSQNFMMSILFISLLVTRKSSAGQSLYIALFKMIGTLLPSILFHLKFPNSWLLNYLYCAIFAADLLYCIMIYRTIRAEGHKPLLRF